MNQTVEVKVDQLERLGAETLLYCKTEYENAKDASEVSLDEDVGDNRNSRKL